MPRRSAVQPAPRRRTRFATFALVTFVAIIAVITLWPGPPAPDGQSWLREFLRQAHEHAFPRWITFGTVEFGSNVAMFVPIGLFGALALPGHRWLIVPAAALTSTGIEAIQAMVLPLRHATVQDVVANTLGAFVGYLLAAAVVAHIHRRARRPRQVLPAPALR